MGGYGIFDVEDILPYPCPKCGQRRVLYDGMLVWRRGDRPPRSGARKAYGLTARADYERERIYHCAQCGAEFFQDVEISHPHLFEERVGGMYEYDMSGGGWKRRTFGKVEVKWRED